MADEKGPGAPSAPPESTGEEPRTRHRNRRVAAVLAILFGLIGAHKFYLGNWKAGLVQLVAFFVLTGLVPALHSYVPMAALGLLSCAEAAIYALKSDERFSADYLTGKRWFL